ncbi:hypothetical protein GGR51DRAFT_538996 [Nemania sp. FL0031]|nr:hypothetical protein GGR51DRAFT_538996 [Nemania sp. FL0031]
MLRPSLPTVNLRIYLPTCLYPIYVQKRLTRTYYIIMCFSDITEAVVSSLDQGVNFGSCVNPTKRQNNCVSVSIAKFLGFSDDDELWRETLGFPLRDEALDILQLEEFIKRAGYGFHWTRYLHSSTASAYENLLRDQNSLPFQIVAYVPQSGSGHCVLRVLGEGYKFVCYQDSDAGIDLTTTVQKAKFICVFCLSAPYNSPSYKGWLSRVASTKIYFTNPDKTPCRLVTPIELGEHIRMPFTPYESISGHAQGPPCGKEFVQDSTLSSLTHSTPMQSTPNKKSSGTEKPDVPMNSIFRVQSLFNQTTISEALPTGPTYYSSLSPNAQQNPAWLAECYMPAFNHLKSSDEEGRRELFNQNRLSSMVYPSMATESLISGVGRELINQNLLSPMVDPSMAETFVSEIGEALINQNRRSRVHPSMVIDSFISEVGRELINQNLLSPMVDPSMVDSFVSEVRRELLDLNSLSSMLESSVSEIREERRQRKHRNNRRR